MKEPMVPYITRIAAAPPEKQAEIMQEALAFYVHQVISKLKEFPVADMPLCGVVCGMIRQGIGEVAGPNAEALCRSIEEGLGEPNKEPEKQ